MSSTTGISLAAEVVPQDQADSHHRRRVSPEAGRALEMLGHAIEYLTDEVVYRGAEVSAHSGEVQAVQLLMARNRQIYFSCPTVPTVGDRCRAFLRHYFH